MEKYPLGWGLNDSRNPNHQMVQPEHGGIKLGSSTIYAEAVVAEDHERLHFKVPLTLVRNRDASVITGSFLMVDYTTIFATKDKAGIVFEGPSPFDQYGKCMRFMFRKDAEAFYEAFKRVGGE